MAYLVYLVVAIGGRLDFPCPHSAVGVGNNRDLLKLLSGRGQIA